MMIQNLSMLYSPSFIWSVCSVHADSFVINTDVLRSFLDPLCQKWQLCIFTLTSGTCLYGNSEPNHSDFLTNCSDCNAMNARWKLCFYRFPNGNEKITSEIEAGNTCHISSPGDKIKLIIVLTTYRSFCKSSEIMKLRFIDKSTYKCSQNIFF